MKMLREVDNIEYDKYNYNRNINWLYNWYIALFSCAAKEKV